MSVDINRNTRNTRAERSVKLSQKKSRITALIGTGEDAKNSIVYSLIKWIFWVGSAITLIFTIYDFKAEISIDNASKFLEHVKNIWEIFIPLITLSLGYIFGKNKD